jgi:hypothetical protein
VQYDTGQVWACAPRKKVRCDGAESGKDVQSAALQCLVDAQCRGATAFLLRNVLGAPQPVVPGRSIGPASYPGFEIPAECSSAEVVSVAGGDAGDESDGNSADTDAAVPHRGNSESVGDTVSAGGAWSEVPGSPHGEGAANAAWLCAPLWNLLWAEWGSNIAYELLLPWQRVSRYPGNSELTRKDLLANHLHAATAAAVADGHPAAATAAAAVHRYLPLSFTLPAQAAEFLRHLDAADAADAAARAGSGEAAGQLWIFKQVGQGAAPHLSALRRTARCPGRWCAARRRQACVDRSSVRITVIVSPATPAVTHCTLPLSVLVPLPPRRRPPPPAAATSRSAPPPQPARGARPAPPAARSTSALCNVTCPRC